MNENNGRTDHSKIILIGGGGHAHSIIDVAGSENIAGYVSPQPAESMAPLAWLGNDNSFINDARKSADTLPSVHITLISGRDGKMYPRRALLSRYADFNHPSVVASDATISSTASIAEGCAIMHLAYIGPGTTIGQFSVVNTGAIIEHDVHIGANTFIGPGAVICGGVTIGDDCYIGAGAKIRNGIAIANGTILGMGAVATSNIHGGGTYVGCPAKKQQ